jgi:hypothetical protein
MEEPLAAYSKLINSLAQLKLDILMEQSIVETSI